MPFYDVLCPLVPENEKGQKGQKAQKGQKGQRQRDKETKRGRVSQVKVFVREKVFVRQVAMSHCPIVSKN